MTSLEEYNGYGEDLERMLRLRTSPIELSKTTRLSSAVASLKGKHIQTELRQEGTRVTSALADTAVVEKR